MTPNPDHDDQHSTTDGRTATDRDVDGASTDPLLSRRSAILGVGLGLGLLDGPGEPAARPWRQDVDARGHDLRSLGGLNMEAMAEGSLLTDFDGTNLELDGTSLGVTDDLDVERVALAELRGDLTGGNRVTDLVGDNLVVDDGRLDVTSNWTRKDVLLEPSDDDVDGVEVEDVESPDGETLNVEGDGDLVLSISGDGGAVRIETPGGHAVVLDDADGSESVTVKDGDGNGVEMDADSDTVSISANRKIELNAPEISLSAGTALTVDSGGNASIASSGLTDVRGALVTLGSGGRPAASVGDTVEDGVIRSGNPTVLL